MIASALAVVTASLVAMAGGWPSPLEGAGEWLVEWTPVAVANAILQHLGDLARPAALLGALALALLAGGIAGALVTLPGQGLLRRSAGAAAGLLVLGVVFLWLFPAGENLVDARNIPEMCVILLFLPCLSLFDAGRREHDRLTTDRHARREFLVRTGVILGGAATLLAFFWIRPLVRPVGVRRLFSFRAPRGLPIAGLTSLVTPAGSFYRMDKVLEPPEIGPPDWRLSIGGAAGEVLTLNYAALLAHRRVDRYVTLECVDNPVGGSLMSTALWSGVLADELLREARASGETVVFSGADRQAEGIPREILRATGAMIVYAMNGQTLSREHGYPARLLLPGHYGFKSVKWLERIESIDGPYGDIWQRHGWTSTAEIHTTTRIDLARRAGGELFLAGIAFAGVRGIRAVEVRVNEGTWHRATLGPVLAPSAWVQWAIRLRHRGSAEIQARAIDGRGVVQTAVSGGPEPNGATGWASVSV